MWEDPQDVLIIRILKIERTHLERKCMHIYMFAPARKTSGGKRIELFTVVTSGEWIAETDWGLLLWEELLLKDVVFIGIVGYTSLKSCYHWWFSHFPVRKTKKTEINWFESVRSKTCRLTSKNQHLIWGLYQMNPHWPTGNKEITEKIQPLYNNANPSLVHIVNPSERSRGLQNKTESLIVGTTDPGTSSDRLELTTFAVTAGRVCAVRFAPSFYEGTCKSLECSAWWECLFMWGPGTKANSLC